MCILILMLSLIGIPPLAGFFGKLYVFMEALNQTHESQQRHPDLAGGARAHEFGGIGFLLCARLEGHVPPRGRHETAGRARPRDRPTHCAGDHRRCGLRLDARLADERDAGRRRADADQSGQSAAARSRMSAMEKPSPNPQQDRPCHAASGTPRNSTKGKDAAAQRERQGRRGQETGAAAKGKGAAPKKQATASQEQRRSTTSTRARPASTKQ